MPECCADRGRALPTADTRGLRPLYKSGAPRRSYFRQRQPSVDPALREYPCSPSQSSFAFLDTQTYSPSHDAIGRSSAARFPCRRCGSIFSQLAFPRYTLMWFIHALDAIFELMAVVRKLLSHLIEAAWHVTTERGFYGDNLA